MTAGISRSALLSVVLLVVVMTAAGCAHHSTVFRTPVETKNLYGEIPSSVSWVLEMPDWRQSFRIQSVLSPVPIRMAHVPLEPFSVQSLYIPAKVRPKKTPWATPWEQEEIVLRMNRILMENAIVDRNVRVRMIAHAVVASGWRQNVWNYNAWGVQQGSWEGAWYEMPTFEEDEEGNVFEVPDAAWRSFSDWREAVLDFTGRISADSDRASYRQAYDFLMNPSSRPSADAGYWQSLSEANYFTGSEFTPTHFAQLCYQIRTLLNRVSPPPMTPDQIPIRKNTVACR